jgi:sugar phosphate isomerase/epimerase
MSNELDLVFWPACVALRPFHEQVEAAAAGGFTSMAIGGETYLDLRKSGHSAGAIRRMAEDAGVPIRYYDTVTAWAPIRVPPWAPPEMIARFDIPMDQSLEICDAVGATTILAAGGYPPDSVPREVLIEGFADLCDRVVGAGIWVDLEFMPILGMPDLAAAWSIVGAAKRPNSGIMLDSWHFTKSGSDINLLKSIPAEYLRSFQLSDGFTASRGMSLIEDMLLWREFPGEGEFPVRELFDIVVAGGKLCNVGPEVFSARANAMGAVEAGVHSGKTMRAMLAQAGVRDPKPPAP